MLIKTSKDEIESYLVDAANIKGNCNALYIPGNEEEIIEVIKSANLEKTKITISGGGTGLTGGRVPSEGILVSTEKLNKIIELNKEAGFVIVEPGVYLRELNEKVESQGLFYPPDPTERDCFLGGTIATNASGARTFKYGPTRNFVEEIRIILADGEILNLKRSECFANGNILELKTESGKLLKVELPKINIPKTTKHAAGYYIKENMDAIDLFIGSEGTLGVVTKIKLKLIKKPANALSAVVFFDSENSALNFIAEARELSFSNGDNESGINATCLEYFDSHSLQFMKEDLPNIPDKSKAAVWLEQTYNSDIEEKLLELWFGLILKHDGDEDNIWFASDKSELEKFKQFRHSISVKVNEYISGKNISKVGTDTSVPHEKFKEYLDFMKREVESKNLKYVIYGHAGDSHIHLNMLPNNDEEFKTAKLVYKILCKKAVGLGGTISAEHGIGKLKKEYFIDMFGEKQIMEMAKIKKVFDPNLILNFGNLFNKEHFSL
ncbi:MAG: FAD-binding oxidoreductase [Melioribacteraceae bacterium]|nr:FAD-binding oxidoreductase [Melioribacteraceae bacterium]